MDIQIKKSFSKDIDNIHDKKLLNSIFEIITQIQQAALIKEIKNVKKLEGSKKTLPRENQRLPTGPVY